MYNVLSLLLNKMYYLKKKKKDSLFVLLDILIYELVHPSITGVGWEEEMH